MRKMGLLTMALVLALGSLGVAYAAWTDDLTIDAQVETGYMDVVFTGDSAGTNGAWDKITSVEVKSGAGDKVLEVEMENLYPRADWDDGEPYATLQLVIKNNSTVPVKVTGASVAKTDGSDDLYNALQMSIKEYAGNAFPVTALEAIPFEPLVINPGETSTDAGHADHFAFLIWLSSAAGNDLQDTSVSLEVTITFTQAT